MNRVVIGVFVIFLFLFLGDLINHYLLDMFPGSVIGMVLLFVALQTGIIKEDKVERVAAFMVSTMPIYFLPITVGIVAVLPSIGGDALVGAIVVVIATVVVIPCVGLCQQWFGGKKRDDDRETTR